ncbi:MAG: hypothetical protein ACLGG7_13530 [Bacteriovoracia bacterium]
MIEKKSSDLHLILHDHPEPPRLLVISKKRLQRFLILIPLLVTGLVLFVVVSVLWKGGRQLSVQMPTLPKTTISEAQSESLSGEIKDLQATVANLQAKLTATGVAETDIWLGPVKKPYALQNLTAKKLIKLGNITLEDSAGKRVLRFQLINTGSEADRVTGHIFVFQLDSRGLSPYPAMTQQEWLEGIRFNKGESFAVARLRPVEAPFPPADLEAKFLVIIFNREGDLILREELVGPFKMGAP